MALDRNLSLYFRDKKSADLSEACRAHSWRKSSACVEWYGHDNTKPVAGTILYILETCYVEFFENLILVYTGAVESRPNLIFQNNSTRFLIKPLESLAIKSFPVNLIVFLPSKWVLPCKYFRGLLLLRCQHCRSVFLSFTLPDVCNVSQDLDLCLNTKRLLGICGVLYWILLIKTGKSRDRNIRMQVDVTQS